ncbi:diguanylate cyclase domain-containing protein [Salisediminibacterium halotolerans]|uniref:Diguanylate cyclase (GGDEF) domain-containing protein n=1 Tax=Salisediminibacterium halotolerans TaxID=517425 RepID=A0A1H9W8B4_9BACI|nr:diguanylate cyclase [Salisediminibacterium haloalkalitolerans]SES30019.1 diguanylate cyclase (GGDEF) domain-containing protein [Salisediminibacterium haloalkalitolerans]
MNEHYKTLERQTKEITDRWRKKQAVLESELHRFFYRLKGTAQVTGLTDWYEWASDTLAHLNEESTRMWEESEWERLFTAYSPLSVQASAEERRKNKRAAAGNASPQFVLVISTDMDHIVCRRNLLEASGFQVIAAFDLKRGLKQLYDTLPSVVLIDDSLLFNSGEEMRQQLLEKTATDFIPVIVTAKDMNPADAKNVYASGVMDYIPADKNSEEISALISNRARFCDYVNRAVLKDELTGAYNRRFLNRELSYRLQRIRENEHDGLAVALIDLDHFKQVNDLYGHAKGDEVLQAFVQECGTVAENEDILCRYGGEEFAFIFNRPSVKEAQLKLSALRVRLNERLIDSRSDRSVPIQFSAGIRVIAADEETRHVDELISEADDALYKAKASGRNQDCLFTHDMDKTPAQPAVTFIVVDDDPIVREMIRRQVRQEPLIGGCEFDFITFSDGRTFLNEDWYDPERYYVIVLDRIMPHMDGLEVLKRIRSEAPAKRMIVTMLTSRQHENEIETALKLGADDYLAKPFNAAQLFLRLNRLAERMFVR